MYSFNQCSDFSRGEFSADTLVSSPVLSSQHSYHACLGLLAPASGQDQQSVSGWGNLGPQPIGRCASPKTSPHKGTSALKSTMEQDGAGIGWVLASSLPLRGRLHLPWRPPGLDSGWPGKNRKLLRCKILWGNSNAICIWNLPENKLSHRCPSRKMRCNIFCRWAFPFCVCFYTRSPRTLLCGIPDMGDMNRWFEI